MVEVGIHAVISDEEVGPSVIVVIGGSHRKILALGLVDTCRRSHVAECAVSIVVVKNCGRALIDAGRTVRVYVDKVAVAGAGCVHRDITANVQIQTAVAVIVEKSCASMKRSSRFYPRDSGFVRNIGKGAIAVVVIERIARGDATIIEITSVDKIDVLPAVSVEIRHTESGTEDLANDGHPLVARIVY